MSQSVGSKSTAAIAQHLSGECRWFENIPIGIAILSDKSRFVQVNRALCRFLGYSKQELIGKKVRDITHPADRAKTAKNIRAMQSGGKPLRPYEKRYLHKSGKVVWGEVNPFRFRHDGNTPRYSIAQVVDITERKRLEDALQEANVRLEQRVQERTLRLRRLTATLTRTEHQERRRIANILHDTIQQDLCAMKFLAYEMQQRSSDPAMLALVDRLMNAVDQVAEVVRTLAVDLHPPVLNHLGFKKAIEWLAAEVMGKLKLDVRVIGDKRVELVCDELRIFAFEAVRELLLNVVKHARVETAEVRLSPMRGRQVKIQVRDAGAGFESQGRKPGNGHFGLFRIQERVESFGGRFDLASQPGKGTRATLILPLH